MGINPQCPHRPHMFRRACVAPLTRDMLNSSVKRAQNLVVRDESPTYQLDVLRGQPIKFIHVVTSSELHES